MKNCTLKPDKTLQIEPSKSSSNRDFDFYVGKWKILNKKLKDRLCGSTEWIEFEAHQEMKTILLGNGNSDYFITSFNDSPFEGRTIRLFDPKTRLWSMYWMDSISCKLQPPTVGSFEGNQGRFYCKDVFNDQEIIVEFLWDKSDIQKPFWCQSFSADGGSTWEPNWYMYMTRMD